MQGKEVSIVSTERDTLFEKELVPERLQNSLIPIGLRAAKDFEQSHLPLRVFFHYMIKRFCNHCDYPAVNLRVFVQRAGERKKGNAQGARFAIPKTLWRCWCVLWKEKRQICCNSKIAFRHQFMRQVRGALVSDGHEIRGTRSLRAASLPSGVSSGPIPIPTRTMLRFIHFAKRAMR